MNLEGWAQVNGLTIEEFKKEIFTAAASLGAMDLDARGAGKDEAMKFTTGGDGDKIELFVRYAD